MHPHCKVGSTEGREFVLDSRLRTFRSFKQNKNTWDFLPYSWTRQYFMAHGWNWSYCIELWKATYFILSYLYGLLLDFLFCCFCFSRQGFSVCPRLSWNSLCRPGWPQTQRSACLCLLNTGIKGVHHHPLAYFWSVWVLACVYVCEPRGLSVPGIGKRASRTEVIGSCELMYRC